MDFYDFYRGLEFEAYTYLGAHLEGDEVVFRTFAPAASAVAVIGEFSDWQEVPASKVYDGNFWECRVPCADAKGRTVGTVPIDRSTGTVPTVRLEPQAGQMYKFRIYDQAGAFQDHADPFAFWAEKRPGTASRLYFPGGYEFHDAAYQRKLHAAGAARAADAAPLNIYEVQAGSWRVPEPGNLERRYTYRELADLLVPYLTEMRYTHLELMPITEYPADESWGYQTTGFFAPTSRYGAPDDLKYLIDTCHAAGIGVILDFVAVHFAANDFGLANYDGTALYEYPHADVGQSEWGTCNFMHSRGEVRSFLQSSVWYWIHEFHFDGVRIDAVSNLIYWQGNDGRGVNRNAIEFLQTMNTGLKERCPGALLIAEDSSSYEGVTHPVAKGGLGFDYKWDLGWMNDTLDYLRGPAYGRKDDYHKLTFSIYYYYNERYLLPLSHDEVVHGKATNVQKMNGADEGEKFAQARLLYAYQFAHPGKKLNFMGNELGGPYEYSEKKEIDWWVLRDHEENRRFHAFMRALNEVYLAQPALWAADYDQAGFEWADCGNAGKNAVYAFVRRAGAGAAPFVGGGAAGAGDAGQTMLAVFNFDNAWVRGYRAVLPKADAGAKTAAKLLDSTWERFGGATVEPAAGEEPALPLAAGAFSLDLPPFSAQLFLLG